MSLPVASELEQLVLFELQSFDKTDRNYGSYWDIEDDSVARQNPYILPCPAATESPNGWVSASKVAGTARGENRYYRYYYREKHRIHQKHIRGGNVNRKKAIINANRVVELIDSGAKIAAILKAIEKF
jgi:hypothetical protein